MIQFARFCVIDDENGMEYCQKMKAEIIEIRKKERANEVKQTKVLKVADDDFNESRFTGNHFRPYTIENETKAWAYIKSRAQKFLKDYETTLEEDQALIEKDNALPED